MNGEEATEQGMNNHGFNAQLAEKDAYISELEMELERSTTVADQVQKQLTETLKRLRVSDQYSSDNNLHAAAFINFLAYSRHLQFIISQNNA